MQVQLKWMCDSQFSLQFSVTVKAVLFATMRSGRGVRQKLISVATLQQYVVKKFTFLNFVIHFL